MSSSASAAPDRDHRLAGLLAGLSHALDMTEGQPVGHCIRATWIAVHIGREIGLAEHDVSELYYATLLKDLGCSSNAARICQLYLADDLALKRDFKFVDNNTPALARFVLSHTGLKAGLRERFRALLQLMQHGGDYQHEMFETRCQRGADIALRMRFSETVADAIRNLDEHFDGRGQPSGKRGEAIPIHARIALLAQVADVFFTAAGAAGATGEIRRRSGRWFDPALVAAFERVASSPGFWPGLAAGDIEARVFALEPAQEVRSYDEDHLDEIAGAFADVIDSKSPFTAGHSDRVSIFADRIAGELGYGAERRRWLRRAALLHDIGKLGVSNAILDKPGKLDEAEWREVKLHPAHSETILARIPAFADMAAIAAAHHERLDGKGYPKGLSGDAILPETRILTAADIFDALTAQRPYRGPMPAETALAIMDEGVGTQLDGTVLAALRRAVRSEALDRAA